MSKRTTTRRPQPRRLGRPRDGDSSETRDRLLLVARQAFTRNGFAATTNKQIADAAGITTGAIYHYYSSKADMYFAVYEDVQALVYGTFDAAVDANTGLVDRLCAVLDAAVGLNEFDPTIAGFVVGVAFEEKRHSDLATLLRPLREMPNNFVTRLVRDAHDRGELADDVGQTALEDLLNIMLAGLARFSNQHGDFERHANAVHAMKHLIAGSLISPVLISPEAPSPGTANVASPGARKRTQN